MIWSRTDDEQLKGQSHVRVKDRHGNIGLARVRYWPPKVCGPVYEEIETDAGGFFVRTPWILDANPRFKRTTP